VLSGATSGELYSFFAYAAGFTGGVYVSTGDVNGDGLDDVITGAGANGGPHVRVFSGASGQQLSGAIGSFFAYAPDFTGGVRVASVDANGDGREDVVVATGPGGTFQVRVFDAAAGGQQSNFTSAGIPTGGAFVAAASQAPRATMPPSGNLLAGLLTAPLVDAVFAERGAT
jgi:hypothetical protein